MDGITSDGLGNGWAAWLYTRGYAASPPPGGRTDHASLPGPIPMGWAGHPPLGDSPIRPFVPRWPNRLPYPPPHPKWEGTPSKARLPYPPPPSHTLPFPSPPPIPPSLPLMDGMAMDGWASRRREGGEKGAKRDGRRYEWANRLPSLPWTPPLPSPPSHGMGYGSLPMVRLPGIRDAYPSPLMGYPPPHPIHGWDGDKARQKGEKGAKRAR